MAAGLPVISTTIGVEGLEVRDGKEVLIANEPEDFAEKINLLLKNPALRDKIGQAGRVLVRQKYDWKLSVQKLQEIYSSLE
jgi:glycosyltransferase involved in cell wall biosynthesis